MKRWVQEVDKVLSDLTLVFLQLERSGKCCHGVTLSQCHTLDLLSKKENLAMNELSKQMGLAKSTMTRIVNNMIREGWIEQFKDEGDRRLVNVRLTLKGKKMAERLDFSSREYVRRILRHIPSEKIPQIVASLKLIMNSVVREVQEGRI